MNELKNMIQRQLTRAGIQYRAQDLAPSSLDDLKASCSIDKLIVWAGASDNTIYGQAETNFMFRAWHDSCHILLNAPFTLAGETLVARHQASQVGDLAGNVIMAEVVGQAEYSAKHGEFPSNQIQFVVDYLKTRGQL